MVDRREAPNWGRTRQAKADRALECHQILTLGIQRACDEAAERFLARVPEDEKDEYARALRQAREALDDELKRIHGGGGDEPEGPEEA